MGPSLPQFRLGRLLKKKTQFIIVPHEKINPLQKNLIIFAKKNLGHFLIFKEGQQLV
jgi:hypothetical protein